MIQNYVKLWDLKTITYSSKLNYQVFLQFKIMICYVSVLITPGANTDCYLIPISMLFFLLILHSYTSLCWCSLCSSTVVLRMKAHEEVTSDSVYVLMTEWHLKWPKWNKGDSQTPKKPQLAWCHVHKDGIKKKNNPTLEVKLYGYKFIASHDASVNFTAVSSDVSGDTMRIHHLCFVFLSLLFLFFLF